jgi:hypothetical protein
MLSLITTVLLLHADGGWRLGDDIELPVAGAAVDEVDIAALR